MRWPNTGRGSRCLEIGEWPISKAYSLKDLDNFPDRRKAMRKMLVADSALWSPREGLQIACWVIYRRNGGSGQSWVDLFPQWNLIAAGPLSGSQGGRPHVVTLDMGRSGLPRGGDAGRSRRTLDS